MHACSLMNLTFFGIYGRLLRFMRDILNDDLLEDRYGIGRLWLHTPPGSISGMEVPGLGSRNNV